MDSTSLADGEVVTGQGQAGLCLSDNDSEDDFKDVVAMETNCNGRKDLNTIRDYYSVSLKGCYGDTYTQGDDATARPLIVERYLLPDLKKGSQETPSVNYNCDTCGKSFATKGGLKFHEKHFHTEGKLYCLVCKKPFKLSNDLERHMNTHTGNRPFKCSQCDKAFVCKSSLSQHEKLKHLVGDIYKCSTCAKTFNTESDLNRHSRVHSGDKPFLCNQCPKTFTCKSSLNVHIRTHEGKTFKCNFCKMQFYILSDLQRHETIHTGDKPFKCDLCPNSYSCKSSFKVHLKNAHAHTSPIKISKPQAGRMKSHQKVKITFKLKCASTEIPTTAVEQEIHTLDTIDVSQVKETERCVGVSPEEHNEPFDSGKMESDSFLTAVNLTKTVKS